MRSGQRAIGRRLASRRALGAALAVTAGVLAGGAWGASAGAAPAAGPGPADVILSTSLPGFVAAPAGTFNGPITPSNLSAYTHDPTVLEEIVDGTVRGYLRSWGGNTRGGMGVVADLVVQFPSPDQTTDFLGELQSSLMGAYGATTFPVQKLGAGAMGFSAHGAIVPRSVDVAVAFGRGDFASFVLAATPGGSVTAPQIELMAAAQWAALPGGAVPSTGGRPIPPALSPAQVPTTLPASALTSSDTGGIEALAVLFVFLLVVGFLVVLAAEALGRRRRRALDEAGPGSVSGAGPLAPGGAEPA